MDYKSPAKILRNTKRITNFLRKKWISTLQPKSLLSLSTIEIPPKNKITPNNPKPNQPQLARSVTLQTSFPEPCIVCSKHQCDLDFQHLIMQTVTVVKPLTDISSSSKTDCSLNILPGFPPLPYLRGFSPSLLYVYSVHHLS